MTTYQEEKFPYGRDDSAVSKDQTTDCPKNQAMSQPGKQEVFDKFSVQCILIIDFVNQLLSKTYPSFFHINIVKLLK